MRTVMVKGLPVIGRGRCGNVYLLSEDRIIKTYNSFVPFEAIEKERRNALFAHRMGVPGADVFDIVRTEEGNGLIYERIDAPSLEELMKKTPEKTVEYAREMGALCRKVHGIQDSEGAFPDAKEEFLNRLRDTEDLIREISGEEALEKTRQLILSVPDASGIVHGDFHPENILVRDGKMLLIDLADVMHGHPVFDLLSLYFLRVNKIKLWETVRAGMSEIPEAERVNVEDIIGKLQENTFSKKMSEDFWSGFASGYLGSADEAAVARFTRVIDGYSYLYMALCKRSEGFLGKTIVRTAAGEGVRVLMERYDELRI